MIGYVMLGTNDLARGAKFYDLLLAEIGGHRLMESEQFVAWSDKKGTGVGLTLPFDGQQATIGNGSMVAFEVETNEMVDKMYAKAIELGAECEGPAGFRGGNFYAGYFRDLDGNKCNFYCVTK